MVNNEKCKGNLLKHWLALIISAFKLDKVTQIKYRYLQKTESINKCVYLRWPSREMWHAEGQGRDFDGQQSGCHGNATFRSLDSPKVPGWGTSSFTDSPESPKKQRVIDIGSLGLNLLYQ